MKTSYKLLIIDVICVRIKYLLCNDVRAIDKIIILPSSIPTLELEQRTTSYVSKLVCTPFKHALVKQLRGYPYAASEQFGQLLRKLYVSSQTRRRLN